MSKDGARIKRPEWMMSSGAKISQGQDMGKMSQKPSWREDEPRCLKKVPRGAEGEPE